MLAPRTDPQKRVKARGCVFATGFSMVPILQRSSAGVHVKDGKLTIRQRANGPDTAKIGMHALFEDCLAEMKIFEITDDHHSSALQTGDNLYSINASIFGMLVGETTIADIKSSVCPQMARLAKKETIIQPVQYRAAFDR
ncbi:hypothetical protein T10_5434 [Trichinella papuae]|uniref:Uncharacterized protein n=1 Tax=Trichinella papuae TaxID=268474 RepID=A0A0V1MRX5_9BILA|nr:hypothetical protein T10_5434 [Trichinella papuae]